MTHKYEGYFHQRKLYSGLQTYLCESKLRSLLSLQRKYLGCVRNDSYLEKLSNSVASVQSVLPVFLHSHYKKAQQIAAGMLASAGKISAHRWWRESAWPGGMHGVNRWRIWRGGGGGWPACQLGFSHQPAGSGLAKAGVARQKIWLQLYSISVQLKAWRRWRESSSWRWLAWLRRLMQSRLTFWLKEASIEETLLITVINAVISH